MILVRATRLTQPAIEFADAMAAATGMEVAFALDGRHPVLIETQRPVISITREACEAIGLFCPDVFTWRCGDYGLYLARAMFPDVRHFWLIEDDMRVGGPDINGFFGFFDAMPDVDYLACEYQKATPDWWWYHFVDAKDVTPYRCLFGVIRISAPALDHLLQKRQAHSKRALRRKLWPNDESFVATTLTAAQFRCAAVNSFGREFYDDVSLSLTQPVRGEDFRPEDHPLRLYHPILFGEAFERGNTTRQGAAAMPKRRPWHVRAADQALNRFMAAQTW